jgi:trigger factor
LTKWCVCHCLEVFSRRTTKRKPIIQTSVNTDVKELSATRSTVTASFDVEEIQKKRAGLIKEFSKQVKIPGFRPGKVPVHMIESRFKKELQNELNRSLIGEAYEKAVTKSDLDVFALVNVDEGEFEAGKEGQVVFTVDLNPQFELPEYTGIPVESPPTEASDEDVEKALEQMLSERAEFKVVEKEVAEGDYVKCSYEGKVGRKLIADLAPDQSILGTQKNTWEEAGSTDAPGISSIVEGLVGMKAGDTKKVEHTFAKDHAVEALQGKKATYQLEVHEVREKVMPEIDEAFLQSVNAESEEALRTRMKDSIESQKKQQAYGQQRNAVGDYLRAAVEFEIPESAIESQKQIIMEDFAAQHMRMGIPEDKMQEEVTKNMDQIEDTANQRAKVEIIIHRIAKEEKLEVTQEDLSQILYTQAMQSGTPIDQLVQEIKKDQDRLNSLRQSALFNKTLQFLVEKAKITEVAA